MTDDDEVRSLHTSAKSQNHVKGWFLGHVRPKVVQMRAIAFRVDSGRGRGLTVISAAALSCSRGMGWTTR